jgi:hypothetical protein
LIPGPGRRDLLVVALLFVVAAVVGSVYTRFVIASGSKPRFYQTELAPAVMSACDRGYVNPDLTALPELGRFLNLEVDSFSCSTLRPEVATLPLSPMQRAFQYQELVVAFTWRWVGVSWTGLATLSGVLFAITTVAGYGLFRTAAARILAVAGALALVGSTLQLIHLPNLRDYSKAPFLVAAACCLVWLVRLRLSPRALVSIGACYGVWLGLGMGFRNDLLIAIPPFVATVFFFRPGRLRDDLGVKAAAVAAALLAFWVTMAPMRAIYAPGGGNSMQHVLLLGLGDGFNADLGVTNDGLYSWGRMFTDEYAHVQTSSYATRMWGATHALNLYGSEYDRAASEMLATVATEFPADMLVRVYASILRTLAIPYSTNARNPPTLVKDRLIVLGYSLRDQVLRGFGNIWPAVAVAALVGLAAVSLRFAIFFVLMVVYFGAYPVLQFNERHFFHLEVIGLWILVLVTQQVVTLAVRARDGSWRAWLDRQRERRWGVPALRAGLVVTVLFVLTTVPLSALRRYQSDVVRTRLNSYIAMPKEPLQWSASGDQEGTVRIAVPELPLPVNRSTEVQSGLIIAEFSSGLCDSLKFDMTLRYNASSSLYDFTHAIRVEPPAEPGGMRRIFAPVFAHKVPSWGMDGVFDLAHIEIPAASAACLSGLYRTPNLAGVPLLMDVNLPNRWEDATPYQTLASVERRSGGEPSPEIYSYPFELPVGRRMITQTVEPVRETDIDKRASNLTVEGTKWRVAGAGGVGGRGPFMYLAQMKPRDTRAGELVLARGHIERGGVSLGLVQNGEWVVQVPVVTPGEFVVVIQVPRDGRYALILANNITGWSLDNRLTLELFGWARGI